MKVLNNSAKPKFTFDTNSASSFLGETVDGNSTKIYKVATQGPEVFKKITVACFGNTNSKSIANGPIEPGICLIKEESRSWRRFADEKNSHLPRPILPSQAFSLECSHLLCPS